MSTLRFGGGPAAVLHETRARFLTELRARLEDPHLIRSELTPEERERILNSLVTVCGNAMANAIMQANHIGRNDGKIEGVPCSVDQLRETAKEGVQVDTMAALSGSQLSAAEIVPLSRFAGKMFDSIAREHIDESHLLGVNHAASKDDHDRPTKRVTK